MPNSILSLASLSFIRRGIEGEVRQEHKLYVISSFSLRPTPAGSHFMSMRPSLRDAARSLLPRRGMRFVKKIDFGKQL
jgi:hypothetical protein